MRDERGYILLTALLALMALSLLGARMVSLARSSMQTTAQRHDSAVLEAAADGAVDRAVFDLLRSAAKREPSSLDYSIDLPGVRVYVTCGDLGGRINPNLASPRLFSALLRDFGAGTAKADRIAAALVDARTPGAGTSAGPFEDVGRLAGVAGMTPDLLVAVAPHLSVWWPSAPDPALAAAAVRRALTEADEMELAAATRPEGRVIRIEVKAVTASGRTLTRRAVVRLGLGLDGRSWHVLASRWCTDIRAVVEAPCPRLNAVVGPPAWGPTMVGLMIEP
jgi:general secretion pathway protein K